MKYKSLDKWYNNTTIVDTLLFLLPPVGLYGLYKTERLKHNVNKVFYGVIGFISLFLIIIYLS
ncbi:hypothetical protein [Aequorivita viscosa]|uniref:Uncharacterized protein n=1 Tax=Aequorivita viscosa TaxID=797419 RepID=A0A1M6I368_9FLAO|nr:hypothetical protein [Aequorivita viscosa]SDX01105.1 hypothetical protein SAMN05216556_11466 [Aequorivita viscosa]SHJ28848.1 hypothetical protein SAMN04487908_11311 [Aequorivita viscosa]